MKRIACIVLLLLAVATAPGCVGTLFSRNKDFIGKYPYEGVFTSGGFMVMEVVEEPLWSPLTVPLFLGFVIPLDLVCDTVLLPADLIGWCFGMRRNGPIDWR